MVILMNLKKKKVTFVNDEKQIGVNPRGQSHSSDTFGTTCLYLTRERWNNTAREKQVNINQNSTLRLSAHITFSRHPLSYCTSISILPPRTGT